MAEHCFTVLSSAAARARGTLELRLGNEMIAADLTSLPWLQRQLGDRFSIVRQLGAGGMAVVYEALDTRYQRPVALKVMRPELAQALGARRFDREIRIAARLSHPHIVPVHESGAAGDLLYYVMPLVEGESLRALLERKGQLELQEALGIVREVGRGLAYAHQEGVIHRDLKPENVMLTRGVAMVADFGIALGPERERNDRLTGTGLAIGTPAYMSPEQSLGESQITAASDIYSLGCIVYEMLAGKPPFAAGSRLALLALKSSAQVAQLDTLRTDLPRHIALAVSKAMAPDPAQRFQSVEEFLAALDAPAGAARRAVPRLSRVAALLLLAVLAGFTAWRLALNRGRQTSSVTVVAVLPFEHIGPAGERYFTEGIAGEIAGRIAELPRLRVIPPQGTGSPRSDMVAAARQLGAAFLLLGTVRMDPGRSWTMVRVSTQLFRGDNGHLIWREDLDAALTAGEMFRVQRQIADSVAAYLNVGLRAEGLQALSAGQTENIEAYRSYLRGNLHASQFLVRSAQAAALEEYGRAVELDPNFALAYARLAQTSALYSGFDRSAENARRTAEAVERAERLRPNDPETRIAKGAYLLFVRKRPDSAMLEFSAARSSLASNPYLHWAIGWVQRQRGHFAAAESSFAEAVRVDPLSPMMLFESAVAAFMLQHFNDALTRLDRVLELAPSHYPARISRMSVAMYAGRISEARALATALSDSAAAWTPTLVSEVLYRPLWDLLLPEPFWDALEHLTLANPVVDSAGYYLLKGRLFARRRSLLLARAYYDSLATYLEAQRGRRPANVQDLVNLAWASLGKGETARATALADSAWALDPLRQDAFRGAFVTLDIVRLLAAAGAKTRAVAILDSSRTMGGPLTPGLLQLDPAFRVLASDTRFQRLSAVR
jgi:TolB-like protein/Tfp pilus assembly protein PilF